MYVKVLFVTVGALVTFWPFSSFLRAVAPARWGFTRTVSGGRARGPRVHVAPFAQEQARLVEGTREVVSRAARYVRLRSVPRLEPRQGSDRSSPPPKKKRRHEAPYGKKKACALKREALQNANSRSRGREGGGWLDCDTPELSRALTCLLPMASSICPTLSWTKTVLSYVCPGLVCGTA